jgi:hypothetical protein
MNDRIWYSAGSPPAGVEGGYHVITNSDARLEVFALGHDGALWWAFQNAQVDGGFAGNLSVWFSLGKPQPIRSFSPLAVGVNGDGRVEVFILSLDASLTPTGFWHIAQEQPGTTTVSGWGGWEQLPAPPTGPRPLDPDRRPSVGKDPSLVVARDSDLTLEVFAFGTTAYNISQSAPGVWSPVPQWQGLLTFDSAAGYPGPPAPLTRFAVVGRNLDGRLEAIAVGAVTVQLPHGDGALVVWHCSQLSADDPMWTDWSIITEASPFVYPTSVAANIDGRLDVFFGTAGGGVFHMEQLNPAGVLPPSWSDVQDLGSPTGSYSQDTPLMFPAVALNPYTGLLEAFAVGTDLALWHATQATADPLGGWGHWESFGSPPYPVPGGAAQKLASQYPLSLAVDAADRVWVFARAAQSEDCYFTPIRFTMPTPKNISIEVTPHWNCGVAENYTITVLDYSSRTPISGALVSLTSGDGTGQPKSKERHGTTNASGSIGFQNVVLKDWKVKIPQKQGAPDWVEKQPQLQVSARGYPIFTTAVDCPPLTPDV